MDVEDAYPTDPLVIVMKSAFLGRPIVRVFHEADGDWQYLTDDPLDPSAAQIVHRRAAWDEQHQPWWGRPSATTQAPVGQYERLGMLTTARDDIWWQVSAQTGAPEVAAEVCEAIRAVRLPALREGRLHVS